MDPQRHGVSRTYVPTSSPPADMSSSPVSGLLSPTRTHRRKEKRNPSVTPRRFGRFFTPRSFQPYGRSILGSLDSAAINSISPQSIFSDPLASDPIEPMEASPTKRLSTRAQDESRKRKRPEEEAAQPIIKRRGALASDMPPPRLNLSGLDSQTSQTTDMVLSDSQESLEDRRKATLNQFFRASRAGVRDPKERSRIESPTVGTGVSKAAHALEGYQPQPIRKFANRGFSAQLVDREHGFSSHNGRQYLAFPACDPRIETAGFYSRSLDVHHNTALEGPGSAIPFSLASCHSAPVTAIGDEEGFIRFFKTTMTSSPSESKVDVHAKIHNNAIMDLAFSPDDLRLATACGDRSGSIVDVVTQTVAVDLNGGHEDTLRTITFQPGQSKGDVLATSDRLGRVQIWDLRCSSSSAQIVNTLNNAHERTVSGKTTAASVTAIQWMPAGREHLLLSAGSFNAAVKLWDTRYVKPRRQFEEIPLAATLEPATHAWRSYGITSLALSSDAARLYAVCKDSTVYAYSTAHLMLGHVPELLDGASKRRPAGVEGLGPLYGLKSDAFRVRSFYVKCALRPAGTRHTSDILAVGSSNESPVLFPTDERYMRAACAQRAHMLDSTPAPTPSQSFSSATAPLSSPVPIFKIGTPLVQGHSREVSTLSWSNEGRLVTASDDCTVRQWQQGGDTARHLRQVGDFGGERHMAGWADVGADWDNDDDDIE